MKGILLPAVSSVDKEVICSCSWLYCCVLEFCKFAVFPSSFLISSKGNSFQFIEQYATQILPVEPGAENLVLW